MEVYLLRLDAGNGMFCQGVTVGTDACIVPCHQFDGKTGKMWGTCMDACIKVNLHRELIIISINLLTSAWNSNDSFGALASFSSSTAKAEGVALSPVATAASSASTRPEKNITSTMLSKRIGEKNLIF